MIAYHFPPLKGSSGLLRTYCFARDLRDHGWQPTVLTVHPMAYPQVEQEAPLDTSGMHIERAMAFDAARHIAIRGRYFGWLALPDRWSSWWLHGVVKGLRLIRNVRPSLIWSTYPIGTAHLIGLILARRSGIPWVADFRDPMLQTHHPSHPLQRRVNTWLERRVLQHCDHAVFTAPGALEDTLARYPWLPPGKLSLIENGYDAVAFDGLEANLTALTAPRPRPLVLLHSGIVYPKERDPSALFQALATLKHDGQVSARVLRVVFRGSVHGSTLRRLARRLGVEDLIVLAPHLPYHKGLAEMQRADGLLVLQARACNGQIPAKLYEYLRARRPILGLTDPQGDTGRVLRDAGVRAVAPLDDAGAIARELAGFLDAMRAPSDAFVNPEVERRHTRQRRAARLAQLFGRIAQRRRVTS
jgi:glycosyltransferase involved in cell wall biosynthesis